MDYHEELRKKLDLFPIGLPLSGDTMRILHLLFSAEDARIAAHVPNPPLMFTADRIARKAGVDKREAAERLDGYRGDDLGSGQDRHGNRQGGRGDGGRKRDLDLTDRRREIAS